MIGRQEKTFVIGGVRYSMYHLGAIEGRQLALRFLQLMGKASPLFETALSLAKKGKLDVSAVEALSDASVVQTIADVVNRVHPDELEPFWEAFSRSAWVLSQDGRQQLSECFDDHFSGDRLFDSVEFFVQSARYNFGGFLGRFVGKASALLDTEDTPSASKSPKTSTGMSGA